MLKGLDDISDDHHRRALPPVEKWDPPFCGDMDLVIQRGGTWMHEGSPIGRPALVRLFASILRLDPEGYMLVTPVEKLRIQVEDTPFRAIAAERCDQGWRFTTDVGDQVVAGPDHALTVGLDPETQEPHPVLHIRRGLMARIERAVFYDLVNQAHMRDGQLWLSSGGQEMSLGAVSNG